LPAEAQAPSRAEIEAVEWYHTLELPGGIVTDGEYDLRGLPKRIGFPASLAGRRCLDVGTRDGFWAFEMERRGAAEVVGIDLDDHARLDWPGIPPQLGADALSELEARSRAFETARRALGSRVERRNLSVYELDPAEVGEFDFACLGTLLLHLRDPVGALKAVRGVLRPGGELLVNDVVSLPLSLLRPRRPAAELLGEEGPFWWVVNVAGLRRMVSAAGLEVAGTGGPYFMANGGARRIAAPPGMGMRARLQRELLLRVGAPHAWVLARRG
jgi:tRNA (mo5U34)-methyltransferase